MNVTEFLAQFYQKHWLLKAIATAESLGIDVHSEVTLLNKMTLGNFLPKVNKHLKSIKDSLSHEYAQQQPNSDSSRTATGDETVGVSQDEITESSGELEGNQCNDQRRDAGAVNSRQIPKHYESKIDRSRLSEWYERMDRESELRRIQIEEHGKRAEEHGKRAEEHGKRAEEHERNAREYAELAEEVREIARIFSGEITELSGGNLLPYGIDDTDSSDGICLRDDGRDGGATIDVTGTDLDDLPF